jgi:hypothetical protein
LDTKDRLKNSASNEAVISRMLHYLIKEKDQTNIILSVLCHDSLGIRDRAITEAKSPYSLAHSPRPVPFDEIT